MITLIKAHVFKYKSIEDSTPVSITDGATVLVGKNESGKTAFLEALHKSHPLNDVGFNPVFDYPRKSYASYKPQHESKSYAKVVELTFRIEKDLAAKINNEVFHGDQVVVKDQTFTRTTNYGNEHLVGLNYDQSLVLAALKKPIKDLEHVNEVFSGAKALEAVITKSQEKELAVDSKLAIFSKEWKERVAKAPKGWDFVSWHVWDMYLHPALPKFIYFGDYNLLEGKINLESLNQRKLQNKLSDADETALGLFDLAGTDIKELMSEEGYENSRAKLEAIGLTITQQIFEYWKQNQELAVEFDIKTDPKDSSPFNNGKNLYIRVKNLKHGVTIPFDQRSKGFIWFFSFMAWFSAVQERLKTDKDLILLLDEPGINLHALAQADFLSYIEKLSESHQIIYTTHSPFMVDSNHLEVVRVVEDRPKEGTRITENLEGSTDESLFPLQAALGYTIAQNLFIAKKNILIEGPADLILLQHMSSLIEENGKTGLDDSILVPVGGLDKLSTFVALLGANKLKIAVLHDRGSNPYQKLDDLISRKLIEKKRVFDFSMFRIPGNQETDIEDLFPESLYIEAFNTVYNKELKGKALTASELGKHPRIIERINQWLKSQNLNLLKDGGFNHYRVAQAMLPKLTHKSLPSESMIQFTRLFEQINATLN